MKSNERSVLNWNCFNKYYVRSLLEYQIGSLPIPGHGVNLQPEFSLWKGFPSVQINAYSAGPDFIKENSVGVSFDSEKPAALTYSIHPNGSIVVTLHPHESQLCAMEFNIKNYIIDYLVTSDMLAGKRGAKRIFEHYSAFRLLSIYSCSTCLPSKTSSRFLKSLRVKQEKFSRVFEDLGDSRRSSAMVELNFGVGLAGGLISSAVVPLLKDIGEVNSRQAKIIEELCQNDMGTYADCLSLNRHWIDSMAANFLTPGWIVVISIVFVVYIFHRIKVVLRDLGA